MNRDVFTSNYTIWSKSTLFGIKIQIYSDFLMDMFFYIILFKNKKAIHI